MLGGRDERVRAVAQRGHACDFDQQPRLAALLHNLARRWAAILPSKTVMAGAAASQGSASDVVARPAQGVEDDDRLPRPS